MMLECRILTTSTKAGLEPVRAYDCWISMDTQRIHHEASQLMNHEGRIFWKTKRKVFNETVFVALKSSSIPLVSDKTASFVSFYLQ